MRAHHAKSQALDKGHPLLTGVFSFRSCLTTTFAVEGKLNELLDPVGGKNSKREFKGVQEFDLRFLSRFIVLCISLPDVFLCEAIAAVDDSRCPFEDKARNCFSTMNMF
ncbi:unnamed protein product [Brassica napus]|uniref:(rape) hypothetical protein n=1 Tax=Brassica napus TaxID=3708 RepID=A0A816KBJ4_BRANA|nr:unnamed protein product [Brassica napus]